MSAFSVSASSPSSPHPHTRAPEMFGRTSSSLSHMGMCNSGSGRGSGSSGVALRTSVMAFQTRRDMTLGDLMTSAAGKSRFLSAPKNRATLREVVLQNRMVNVINAALSANPLSLAVVALDEAFVVQPEPEPVSAAPALMEGVEEQEQEEEEQEDVFDLLAQAVTEQEQEQVQVQVHEEPAVLDSFPAEVAFQLDECARKREQQVQAGAYYFAAQALETDDGSSSSSSATASSSSSSSSGSSGEEDEAGDGSSRARRKKARKERRFAPIGRPIARPVRAESCPAAIEQQPHSAAAAAGGRGCGARASPFDWGRIVDASTLRQIASC
jgi:hypothetical protein